jgi:LemA protein
VISIWFAQQYNALVSYDEAVKKSFSELQATYQRRIDLVPQLISVVKANAAFEQTVMEQVAEARNIAEKVTTTALPEGSGYEQMEQAQAALVNSANRLLAVVENYPNLKASEAFLLLQTQLTGTERRVKIARKDLNTVVQAYNVKVRQFPSSLAARILGYKPKTGFQADLGTDEAPEIKF